MIKVNCNLCHSTDASQLYQITDFLLNRPEVVTTLVRCRQCGLIYQNPRPSFSEMADFYPPNYESFNSANEKERASWLINQAVQYGINKRIRFVTKEKRTGKLLDVGCATGVFLQAMQAQPGWTVKGLEVNDYAAEIARKKGLDVFKGTLLEADYPSRLFDAVTLWDVLEHLEDPSTTLKEIHRILNPGGALIFRVPNARSWDARIFGPYWAGLDSPRHLFVFDPDTITQLLKIANFEVKNMSCRSGGYLSFILSVRFWMVAKNFRESTKVFINRTLNHPLTRIAVSPIFLLGSLGLRGSQLIVTAIKTNKPE